MYNINKFQRTITSFFKLAQRQLFLLFSTRDLSSGGSCKNNISTLPFRNCNTVKRLRGDFFRSGFYYPTLLTVMENVQTCLAIVYLTGFLKLNTEPFRILFLENNIFNIASPSRIAYAIIIKST